MVRKATIIIVLVVSAILLTAAAVITWYFISSSKSQDTHNASVTQQEQNKTFDVFPARFEDAYVPPKMYGLWPFGVKGNTSSSHNEGHPGWDLELKAGAKVYAIGDLRIVQIHEGDHQAGSEPVQVIEASARLNGEDYHIVYHSVTNLQPGVEEGATIKAGEPLADAGYPLSEDSRMIHFGIFPPGDSIGSCPTPFFSAAAQEVLNKFVANSINMTTGKPYESACVGKINREVYLQNYPDREQYFGGNEQFE